VKQISEDQKTKEALIDCVKEICTEKDFKTWHHKWQMTGITPGNCRT